MQEETLDGHLARPVVIDLCFACQSFWFDAGLSALAGCRNRETASAKFNVQSAKFKMEFKVQVHSLNLEL